MFLIIGLGNPGKEYENTRHNIGFNIINQISSLYNFPEYKTKFQSLISESKIDGQKVILLKPQTYMNNSGDAVLKVVSFLKINISNIIVIHDELDLALGKVRVKTGGGSGGHNGLGDIDIKLGKDYKRIRIGIGHPGDKDMVSDYVLNKFFKEEQPVANKIIEQVAENIPSLLIDKDNLFMSRIAESLQNEKKANI